ncbi:proteasome assembly chaperone 2-like [Lytechinus pictus]|uniref:proteasome assembly chaperone 2-like n=1 Tax=Lytechinus pictus TaxID=7653 RepID=UPI0030B9B80B
MTRLIQNMPSNRLLVNLSGFSSKWWRQKNGHPQRSVLVQRATYADERYIASQKQSFEEVEKTFSDALAYLDLYYPEKTKLSPAISVGNIGQLTCDLIINTLKLTKTGCFSDQSLQPLCGNDAFHSEGIAAGKLVTSAEVYESREKKIVVIQQRADLVQGRTSEFRRKLIDWIKESGFSKVLLLTSCFAYEKTDAHIQSNTYRYLMTPSLEAKRDEFVSNLLKYSRLEKKPVEEGLELTSQQDIPEAGRDIHLPGGGIARKLFIDW